MPLQHIRLMDKKLHSKSEQENRTMVAVPWLCVFPIAGPMQSLFRLFPCFNNIPLVKKNKKLHHNSTTLSAASVITTTRTMIPTSSSRRLSANNDDFCCSDHNCCKDKDSYVPPADVQKGSFAVYIVDSSDEVEDDEPINITRYVIPVSYLRHRVFEALLRRAEEEFGFSPRYKGGIRFPCETVLFDHLLWLLNRDDPSIHSLEVDELLNFYRS